MKNFLDILRQIQDRQKGITSMADVVAGIHKRQNYSMGIAEMIAQAREKQSHITGIARIAAEMQKVQSYPMSGAAMFAQMHEKKNHIEGITGLASVVATNKLLEDRCSLVSGFDRMHSFQSNKSIAETLGFQNSSAFGLQSSLLRSAEYSSFAERALSTFPWESVGKRIGLNDTSKSLISNSFLDLSTNYSDLIKSYSANPNLYIELSPSLIKTAPVEFYTGANLLELISTEEEITTEEVALNDEIRYENEYSLNTYLPKVRSELLNMWKGAIETFNSNNSDKVRQFTVSLRELFSHLIHILAPDNEVKVWTSKESFFHKGRPTRQARLHYICRNISDEPLNKFVEKNIQATVEFINIFQDGTHSIDSSFTKEQLIAMKSKAESSLKFILEIEFSVNR